MATLNTHLLHYRVVHFINDFVCLHTVFATGSAKASKKSSAFKRTTTALKERNNIICSNINVFFFLR